jgi:hypothetical protein
MKSVAVICLLISAHQIPAQSTIPPRTWDSSALTDWATPLASINIRPGYFSEREYYMAPTDNYRTYPVYHPDREPPGYWEALKKRKPEPLVDIATTGPTFNWVVAGKRVWDEIDVPYFRLFDTESIAMARSADYVRKNERRLVVRPDGTLAMYRWVVTPQGMGLSITACSSCHTRYLNDGTAVAVAGFAHGISDALLERMGAQLFRLSYAGDRPQIAFYRQFGVPWIRGDIHEKLKVMPDDGIAKLFGAQVPGVIDRPNGSPYYITKVPDLVGFRDRKYIDHTATHRHRGAGDLMRYAALVEYSDAMEFGTHHMLTDDQRKIRIRWPDEVLYALSQYIYSLQPPPNPNKRDEQAIDGEKIFARVGCAGCHTPPLYTNNKLTLAKGFKPPDSHPLSSDILPISVGTDTNLALRTRKGTGLYKVPSLKGVWYRGLYGHEGAVTSLEDWLDPARLQENYVPGGFKGVGITTRAIPGHEFGLNLSLVQKKALVAFLRVL